MSFFNSDDEEPIVICPGGQDGPCLNEGECACDDCTTKVCTDHWITCAGDEDWDGCDAGLCPDCWEEHVSQHVHERMTEEEDAAIE